MADEADDDHPPTYPPDSNLYKIREVMGKGVSSIVFKAICTQMDPSSFVAIKLIDPKKSQTDTEQHQREAEMNSLFNLPTLKPHCFINVTDGTSTAILVVMPFMPGGSLQSIIASSYPDGLPERCIATILKEILTVLAHIHGETLFYGDIKAGEILIDSTGSVKLADSSISTGAWIILPGARYWMAPEVVRSRTKYGEKTDIWSFGITALDLAHGKPPLSNSPSKKISQSFRHMICMCLDRDPSKRPTAKTLLKHPFFQNCGGTHFLIKNILPKGEQIDRLGRKMIDEGVEEIHGWKFNAERFVLDFIPRECYQRSSHSGELNRDVVMKAIKFLLGSLDHAKPTVQRFSVSILKEIKSLMGEVTTEEKMQEILDMEDNANAEVKWFLMEEELNKLFAVLSIT